MYIVVDVDKIVEDHHRWPVEGAGDAPGHGPGLAPAGALVDGAVLRVQAGRLDGLHRNLKKIFSKLEKIFSGFQDEEEWMRDGHPCNNVINCIVHSHLSGLEPRDSAM